MGKSEEAETLEKWVGLAKQNGEKIRDFVDDLVLDLYGEVKQSSELPEGEGIRQTIVKTLPGTTSLYRTSQAIANAKNVVTARGVLAFAISGVWFATNVEFVLTNESTSFAVKVGDAFYSSDTFVKKLLLKSTALVQQSVILEVGDVVEVAFP